MASDSPIYSDPVTDVTSSLSESDDSPPSSPNLRSHPITLPTTNTGPTFTTPTINMNPSPTVGSTRTPDMMPPPGTKSAPSTFRGKAGKVKQFLRRYIQLCSMYNVPPRERCELIVDYCSSTVVKFIEALSSYITGDWDILQQDLLSYYDAERKDSRYMTCDLQLLTRKWRKKCIKKLSTWKNYQREFITIAGWLRSKGKLTLRMM
jgi:predicted nucleic acid-binding protein